MNYPREDLGQIIYALERAASDQQRLSDELLSKGDYSAEIPAADASSIHKAIGILSKLALGEWLLCASFPRTLNGDGVHCYPQIPDEVWP